MSEEEKKRMPLSEMINYKLNGYQTSQVAA